MKKAGSRVTVVKPFREQQYSEASKATSCNDNGKSCLAAAKQKAISTNTEAKENAIVHQMPESVF